MFKIGDGSQPDEFIKYFPFKGLASVSIQQKKILLVTDPKSYPEYDDSIDLIPVSGANMPIMFIPIMDREEARVEGCIEVEFRKKHYLTSNPLT